MNKKDEKIENISQDCFIYKEFFNRSLDGMCVIDTQGHFIEINQTGCDILGFSREDILKSTIFDIGSGKIKVGLRKFFEQLLDKRKLHLETTYRRKDLLVINIEINAELIEKNDYKLILIFIRDISEQKITEYMMRESSNYLENLIDYSNVPIIVWDPLFRITRFNNAFEQLTGFSAEEVMLKDLDILFPEQSRSNSMEYIKRAQHGERWESVEIPIKKKSGEIRVVLWNSANIISENNARLIATIAQGYDITERKKAEEALKESEERYRTLVEVSPELIAVHFDGKIIYINKSGATLLGAKDPKEIIGKEFLEFVHKDSYDIVIERINQIKKNKKQLPFIQEKFIKNDGTDIYVDVTTFPINYNGKPAIQIIAKDITELVLNEKELLKSHQLESLGILAGGIAHDFNNILSAISTNIASVKMYTSKENESFNILSEIEKEAIRATELTVQLLTFSKGGAPLKKVGSIENLLKDNSKNIFKNSNISYELDFSDDLYQVEFDEEQMHQVFRNMLINSKQAVSPDGHIEIKAENVCLAGQIPLPEGKYIKISIKDNGCGIKPENIDKIFEPYFTTKKTGSGLGLTVAFSIIKKHNGHITVESKPGKTVFNIYIPEARVAVEKQLLCIKTPAEKGKILIMDDEPAIIRGITRVLTRLGFKVENAQNGIEAIEKYRKAYEKKEPINIVIMDLTIPGGMGGIETIKELRKIDPDIKAIVSSGYSLDSAMADYKKHGFSAVIPKPINIDNLINKINELMSLA